MKRTLKSGIFICLLSTLFAVQAQDTQSDYLKAKEYLNNEEYTFAIDLFGKISKTESPYADYASFYFALAAYKNDQIGLARSMWLQILEKNKDWVGISDVHYWLSKIYFEDEAFDKAIMHVKKSKLDVSQTLMVAELSKVDSIAILEEVHYIYSYDASIAKILADRLIEVPISDRNFQLLQKLVEQFKLDREKYGLPKIGQSTMKAEYKVAVMLPFLFGGLETAARTARNKFIMDIYTGMQEAADRVNQNGGAKIRLIPYDTRRDSATVAALLQLEELKSMDLIVGPLFPQPVTLVADFSFANQINMINPLSVNSDLIRYNPYSFLFRPTVETQALVAAEMVIDSVYNKNAMIFYEDNPRDSLSAYTYSQRIQEAGFEVLLTLNVRDTTIQSAMNILTEKYETAYTEEEKDSILTIDESRIIKERKSIKEKDVIEYYEEFFKIAQDSIGHIYMASSKPLYASSIISAVEVRADSTKIIGRGEWKNFETITFEELERLGILLIDADYIDLTSAGYRSLRSVYLKKYHDIPTMNNMLGYEMMYYMGKMLQQYGNYFQNGTSTAGFQKGQLFYGTDFRFANSNQFVPMTKLMHSKTKVLNTQE